MKSKPTFWTPERVEELHRCLNREWTSDRIAKHFGRSIAAVRTAASKHGITSRARHAAMQSNRMRGRKDSAQTKRLKAEAMRLRHQDPITGPKLRAKGALAGRKADRQKAWATLRGYHVPEEIKPEYDRFRRKLRSAREAARVLGLIPAQEGSRA